MVDSLQIILLFLLFAVIIIFIVLGIQVLFLLQDVRKTISKANKVLDTTGDIAESITEPLSAVSGIFGTLSTGAVLSKVLRVAVKSFTKSEKHHRGGGDE